MSVSIAFAKFSLFYMDIPLSPKEWFLMEVTLHSDGLCILKFHRNFPPVSLLHQYHAVSFQVLILDSLPLDLMFFLIQIGFSLKSSPRVFLVLDLFMLWYLLLVLFLMFFISTCRASIFPSIWEGAFHPPFYLKFLNLLPSKSTRSVGIRSCPFSQVSCFL